MLQSYAFLLVPLNLSSRPKNADPFVLPGLTSVATSFCRILRRAVLIVMRLLNSWMMRLVIRTVLGPVVLGEGLMAVSVVRVRWVVLVLACAALVGTEG